MKEKFNRIFAVLLSVAMVATMTPAFAVEANAETDPKIPADGIVAKWTSPNVNYINTFKVESNASDEDIRKTIAAAWTSAAEMADEISTEFRNGGVEFFLYTDWIADENGEFGEGYGFSYNGAIYVPEYVRMTVDLGGNTIDRNLSKAIDDGEVIYVRGDNDINKGRINTVTIKNGTVTGGYSNDYGAGIRFYRGAYLTLEDLSIIDNKGSDLGGGIYLGKGGVLTANNCTVSGNTASYGGGIYVDEPFTGITSPTVHTGVFMTDCTVSGNTASEEGGGIYLEEASKANLPEDDNDQISYMRGCTFTGNHANGDGGGIYVDDESKLVFEDSGNNTGTVTGNTSKGKGAGIFLQVYSADSAELRLGGKLEINRNYKIDDEKINEAISNIYFDNGTIDDEPKFSVTKKIYTSGGIGITGSEDGQLVTETTDTDIRDSILYTSTVNGIGFSSDDPDYDIVCEESGSKYKFKIEKRGEDNPFPVFQSYKIYDENGMESIGQCQIDKDNRTVTVYVPEGFEYETAKASFTFDNISAYATDFELKGSEEPAEFYVYNDNQAWLWSVTAFEVKGANGGVLMSVMSSISSEPTEFFYIGTDTFEEGWKYATEQAKDENKTVIVKLYRDWLAGDDNYNGVIDKGEEKGVFGTGDGFNNNRLYVSDNADIILDLNGYAIDRGLSAETAVSNGQVFRLKGDAKLTIIDTSEAKTGRITGGGNTGNGGAFYMDDGAKLIIEDGSITGNYAKENGAGIYASKEGGETTVSFNGGSITNNTAGKKGGGIYWQSDDGKLLLIDVKITGNTAKSGGGVLADNNGSDPYVGGSVYIFGNTNSDGEPDNLCLLEDDSNLNQSGFNELESGSLIGVNHTYSKENDLFSADGSRFDESSIIHFIADDPEYTVRMVDSEEGSDNRYKLYITKKDNGNAVGAQADIISAEFAMAYGSAKGPEITLNTVTMYSNPIFYNYFFGDYVSLGKVIRCTASEGATIINYNQYGKDFIKGEYFDVYSADFNTVKRWFIKVLPYGGEWTLFDVNIDGAEIIDPKDGYYFKDEVTIVPKPGNDEVFKSWAIQTDDGSYLGIEDNKDGTYSFTMPDTNVTVCAEYVDKVNQVDFTLDKEVKKGIVPAATASYIWNATNSSSRKLDVSWFESDGTSTLYGKFEYGSYYAVIELPCSKLGTLPSDGEIEATINGVKADVSVKNEDTIVAKALFTTMSGELTGFESKYYLSTSGGTTADEIKAQLPKITDLQLKGGNIAEAEISWEDIPESYDPAVTTKQSFTVNGSIVLPESISNPNDLSLEVTADVNVYPAEQAIAVDHKVKFDDDTGMSTLTLSTQTDGAQIYYSTDGGEPDVLYNGTLTAAELGINDGVKKNITLKTVAKKEGMNNSDIVEYTIELVNYAELEIESTGVSGLYGNTDGEGTRYLNGEIAKVKAFNTSGAAVHQISYVDGSGNKTTMDVGVSEVDITIDGNILVTAEYTHGAQNVYLSSPELVVGQTLPTDIKVEKITYNHRKVDNELVYEECTDAAELAGWISAETVSWAPNTIVEHGMTYVAEVLITAKDGYGFIGTGPNVFVDDKTVSSKYTNGGWIVKLHVESQKDSVTKIMWPDDMSLMQGEEFKLPEKVAVTSVGGSVSSADVTWDISDLDVNKVGTYTVSGTVTIPENVLVEEGVSLTKEINITVNKNPALTLNAPKVYTYIQNDTYYRVVELYSDTPGATIYYNMTDDGTEPNVPDAQSTKYTGEELILDESKTYWIKAVAVKENYNDSEAAEFKYTVDIPTVYTVTGVDSIDGTDGSPYKIGKSIEGESITVHYEYKDGKAFVGWEIDPKIDGVTDEELKDETLTFTMPDEDVTVTAKYISKTDSVSFSNINTPVAYMPFDTQASVEAGDRSFDDLYVTWKDENGNLVSKAVYNKTYTGVITLRSNADEGFVFDDSVEVNGIEGAKAEVSGDICTITFEMTAEAVNMSENLDLGEDNVTYVDFGTSKEDVLKLFSGKLTVITEAGDISVDAEWDCDEYSGETVGEYIFTAELDLENAGIDQNSKKINAQVKIIVQEKKIDVPNMPTASKASGTYYEDLSVALSCSTDGSAIYYTTDGNEPDVRDENLYDGEIAVEGTVGKTENIVVKAVSVLGEGKSATAVYNYTIKLPVTITVEGGTLADGNSSGEFQPGESVTVIASELTSQKIFTGWSSEDIEIEDAAKKNLRYTFEAPEYNADIKASYDIKKVTKIVIRVDEPKAGSALDEEIAYDMYFNDGSASKNNALSKFDGWSTSEGDDQETGAEALRGKAYSFTFESNDRYYADDITAVVNGEDAEVNKSADGIIVSYDFDTVTSAYKSHIDPAPMTGVKAETSYTEIGLVNEVTVITNTGEEVKVPVVWNSGATGAAGTTAYIEGALDAEGLFITGAEDAVVRISVTTEKAEAGGEPDEPGEPGEPGDPDEPGEPGEPGEEEMPTAGKPYSIPISGEYIDQVTVELYSSTLTAKIYYTFGEGNPDTLYEEPILISKSTVIRAMAAKDGMHSSDIQEFEFTIVPTYSVTVNNGNGGGKYKAGTEVTITAANRGDEYFTEWTVETQNVELVNPSNSTTTFIMPEEPVTVTANYEDKISVVNIGIDDAELGKELPSAEDITVSPESVKVDSLTWTSVGTDGSGLMYTAKITISAENGFAEHGTVYVNDKEAASVLNKDKTVTVTYHAVSSIKTMDHYVFDSSNITGVRYGTELKNMGLEDRKAQIVTTDGQTYEVNVSWDYENCGYVLGADEAQTFTVEGVISLPFGVEGNAQKVSVKVSVLEKPKKAPDNKPEQEPKPETECDGGASCPHHRFADLDSNLWYHNAVDFVLNKGMMNGVGEDMFAPNGTTSRSMIVTILWRLEGSPKSDSDTSFSDVPADQWYSEAVKWAASNGIVEGYDGVFNSDGNITREQLATIMWRYSQYKGYDTSVGEDTNILSYGDAAEISDWAVEAMAWACGAGIIEGISAGSTMNLDPNGNATRAQVATILYRYCTMLEMM